MQGNQVINEAITKIKDTTANPAPLGLLGFGMTTVLLNISNAGLYALDTMVLGMGICYGGIAQVIAGIMEWKKGNTFGTVAFSSYGLFWLSLVALLLLPGKASDSAALATYFFMWGLFTFSMFLGTLRLNKALMFIFGSLVILFLLLFIKEATGIALIGTIAGYEGIICGLSAVYTGVAHILNEVYGRVVLSVGPVTPRSVKPTGKVAYAK